MYIPDWAFDEEVYNDDKTLGQIDHEALRECIAKAKCYHPVKVRIFAGAENNIHSAIFIENIEAYLLSSKNNHRVRFKSIDTLQTESCDDSSKVFIIEYLRVKAIGKEQSSLNQLGLSNPPILSPKDLIDWLSDCHAHFILGKYQSQ